jgi:anti-anti-sigma factor
MSDAAEPGQAAGQPSGFDVTVGDATDGVVAVEVAGAVDLLTAPTLGEAVKRAQSSASSVRLDMRQVEFLGSAGLSVLVDAARRAGESDGRLAIVATHHAVLRAVQVTGLDAVLRIFSDPSTADEYLQG